jgi:hypothetical protein
LRVWPKTSPWHDVRAGGLPCFEGLRLGLSLAACLGRTRPGHGHGRPFGGLSTTGPKRVGPVQRTKPSVSEGFADRLVGVSAPPKPSKGTQNPRQIEWRRVRCLGRDFLGHLAAEGSSPGHALRRTTSSMACATKSTTRALRPMKSQCVPPCSFAGQRFLRQPWARAGPWTNRTTPCRGTCQRGAHARRVVPPAGRYIAVQALQAQAVCLLSKTWLRKRAAVEAFIFAGTFQGLSAAKVGRWPQS